jgi:predicted HTH transcriptional regulator
MKKAAVKLIIYESESTAIKSGEKFAVKMKRDISALANKWGGFIILGVDDNGKINGFVSDRQ